MAKIQWKGLGAFVRPGLGFEVVEHTGRWYVYVCGTKLDGVGHDSIEQAQAAAEAVVDELDATTPLPPERREPRRFVENTGPERAPHPGRLRRPPR
jgi:hypothetical protein